MPKLHWDPNVETGHPTIDEQHRAMVEIFNALSESITNEIGREEIEHILETFKHHTEEHLHVGGNLFQALEKAARIDLLTGTWNRRHFDEIVQGEMHRSQRYGHPVSMILFDIDNFKRINDLFGHPEGDRVLKGVAECAKNVIRQADSLTRWGGEEFIVLMPNTGISAGMALAERVREAVALHPFEGIGQVTASFGVAEFLPGSTIDEWLARADRAMYRAKVAGRNRVEVDLAQDQARPAHFEGSFVKLAWSDSYCSGDPQIDSQHMGLFKISNELLAAVLSGRPADETAALVSILIAEVVQHFRYEENLLAERGFPGYQEHAQLHEDLILKALEHEQAFRAGTLGIGSLFQFLAMDVVAKHMLQADREFFYLLQAR